MKALLSFPFRDTLTWLSKDRCGGSAVRTL